MKNSLVAVFVAVGVFGCAELPLNLRNPESETKRITLVHVKTVEELRRMNCGLHQALACAIWYRDHAICTIYIYRLQNVQEVIDLLPSNSNDRKNLEARVRAGKINEQQAKTVVDNFYMYELGHELRHCFEGQFHDQ